jgi:hypothetical protein
MASVPEIMNEIYRIINEETIQINKYGSSNDTKILEFMNGEMHNSLFPLLKKNYEIAEKYRRQRDLKNEELFGVMREMHQMLKHLFEDDNEISVHLMSSLGARLNTIEESDMDFGVLIAELNERSGELNKEKFDNARKKLETLGFIKANYFNIENPTNRYFAFEKMVCGIVVEVKIRDTSTTQIFLDLHNQLDNCLSEEQITIYTFTKKLLVPHKQAYKYFKKILYESAFSNVEGGFVFLMP